MKPSHETNARPLPWAWILVGLLVIGSIGQAIVASGNRNQQSMQEADRLRLQKSLSEKLAKTTAAYEENKTATLISLETLIQAGKLHQALFESHHIDSRDPDLQNTRRTITAMLRPGQDLDSATLVSEYACVATIAAVMKRDPRTIEFERLENGVASLSYVRESDGKKWRQKCRLNGTTTQWGDAEGRWQDTPADGFISFQWSADGILLTEHHSDGSSSLTKWAWAKVR